MNLVALLMVSAWLGATASPLAGEEPAADPGLIHVGVAKRDITPDFPVRLSGFGFRRTESEGVNQRIWAKALALGQNDPVLLITVDNLGVSAELGEQLAKRLASKGLSSSKRLVIASSHTHTAPMLTGVTPTLFGVPIPKEHQAHIDQYTQLFLDRLEEVATVALGDRQPSRLAWGVGKADLAKNRRTAGGPVDHDLPVLVVKTQAGAPRAILVNYACHAVTLSHNKVGGDWPGYAQQAIEDAFPGTIALFAIGCGADSNPTSDVTGDKTDVASRQGLALGREVTRIVKGSLTPVTGPIVVHNETISLPLADLPTTEKWNELAKRKDAIGHHARVQLEKIKEGKSLKKEIAYPITTWAFGKSLAMVFLPGEVVVDYSLRLKRELDRSRLWITAYANDAPCYIPSERVLKEGGYEGGGAMVYYDVPAPFRPGLENLIVKAVVEPLKGKFPPKAEPQTAAGETSLSPAESLKTLKAHEGLVAELVVAEPMVASPVAIDFGPDGKLWVAEMLDYPMGPKGNYEPGGRVRLLDEMDNNYKPKRSRIFLDGIPFPTGITVWKKGVLVCAAPDILYAEDTDGDGKADKVEKLYSNFGTGNFQARVNSLVPGLDGWIYGSSGLFGGDILCHKTGAVVKLGNRDFRIKPDTGALEAATGRTQQGRVRDDFGNWFGCDNSTLATHLVLPNEALSRNVHAAYPQTVASIADSADIRRLIPARPVQMFKLSGPPNSVTAACGIGVYRDNLLGEAYQGDLFTCEPVNLLVHRMKLKVQGSTFETVRAPGEEQSEFLASTDTWFRPVQMRTGPDGAVWIVDMHRFVIEHPRWIPQEDVAKLDLRAGANTGRIIRIRPEGKALRPVPRLDRLSDKELIAAMDTPNGTVRDLAMEWVLWRTRDENRSLKAPLMELVQKTTLPAVRAQALSLLATLYEWAPGASLEKAFADPHPGVRRQAARVADESFRETGAIKGLVGLAADADPHVRLEAALALGNAKSPEAAAALARILLQPERDTFLTSAVMSSLKPDNLGAVADALLAAPQPPREVLRSLWQLAAAQSNDKVLLSGLAKLLAQLASDEVGQENQLLLTSELLSLPQMRKNWKPSEKEKNTLAELTKKAEKLIRDPKAKLDLRIASFAFVDIVAAENGALLADLISPRQPPALQAAAIDQLAKADSEKAAKVLIESLATMSASGRTKALDLLLSRTSSIQKLLEAMENKKISATLFDAASRQRLLTLKDKALQARAEKVLDASSASDRGKLITQYTTAFGSTGNPAKGKELFQKSCSVCHKLSGLGHEVGPDLAMVANKSPGWLIQEILDPSRNLDTRYTQYVVATRQGQTFSGLLAEESATSITLKMQEGRTQTILRSDIEEMTSPGKSLMPEGLEKEIAPAAMTDLVAYLTSQLPPPKSMPGNQPATVRLDPKHTKLKASQASIYGREICFESEFGNIGCWHAEGDHVVWTIESPKAAKWDIWLDCACAPEVAGNGFVLEAGTNKITGKVEPSRSWSDYRLIMVGDLNIPAGTSRIVFRPAGPVNGALIDLRTIHIIEYDEVPIGVSGEGAFPDPFDAPGIAKILLDPKEPDKRKQGLIAKHPKLGAELIREMTRDLGKDTKEEYRRIPVIWQVAIAAGKANQKENILPILEVALPKRNEKLRDWQAVVIGGALINGITQANDWPIARMKEIIGSKTELWVLYETALEWASSMADDAKVPTGTRYDALRMVAMLNYRFAEPQLARYLRKGTDDELMMGAVSGLADIPDPAVIPHLVGALGYLNEENRNLAVAGLLRDVPRCLALLEALSAGKAEKKWLSDKQAKSLLEHADPKVREKAKEILGK